jgi:DNA helicase-2/ATP-dependent DNA helicase PcrA
LEFLETPGPEYMILNPEQQAAIAAREGAWVCLATAGAGKTHVLTERVKALLVEGSSIYDILALTFTVEAAKELQKRIGPDRAKRAERGGFRTFHSFGLRLIQEERRHLPFGLSDNPVPEGPVLSKLLSQTMREHGIAKNQFREVRAFISKNKRNRVSPEGALEEVGFMQDDSFARIYQKYQERLRDSACLDFDDMVVLAVELLEKPEVRARWQFKWILVDEFQDTDDLQVRMLQLLAEKYGNIFVVGDFSQALYSFRGAHPENLLNFEKWFPGAKTLILPQNYRSTKSIVDFSRENAPIKNELTENIRTENEQGEKIEFRMFKSDEDEAQATLAAATRDPGNSAILARTNGQLGDFESLCTENFIKFHRLGKSGFWTQSEIKSVVNLAGFALSPVPPKTFSQEAVASLRNKLRAIDAKSAVNTILTATGIENMYANQDYADEDNFALKNLKKLQQIASRFSTLAEFVKHARKAEHASRKSKNAVTLGTIHSAKGLEWANVFVVGVQEGKLPHEKGEIEEEKRIFFVAVSRAAKRLRISFVGSPSQFIKKYLTPEIKQELEKTADKVEKIERQLSIFA